MNTYFRAQTRGIAFSAMKAHVSADGGDDMEEAGGVCACLTVSELLRNTVMDAMNPDDEVVIFRGHEVAEIYDGYRVEPVEEIARFTVREFRACADEIAEKYETL